MTKPLPWRWTGLMLIGLGSAHALLGWRISAPGLGSTFALSVFTVLWLAAAAGTIAAGLGVWRLQPFWPFTRGLALLGTTSSLLMLLLFWRSLESLLPISVDLGLIALFLPPRAEWLNQPDDARYGMLIAGHHRHRLLSTLGVLLVLLVSAFIVVGP